MDQSSTTAQTVEAGENLNWMPGAKVGSVINVPGEGEFMVDAKGTLTFTRVFRITEMTIPHLIQVIVDGDTFRREV